MELDIFRFFFDPDQEPDRLDGWGRASLILDGVPYWHGIADHPVASRYKVSQWLAACQLRNSSCQLSREDDQTLEQYIAKRTSGCIP